MEALARIVPAYWFLSLILVAVPFKGYMEIVSKKSKLPSPEPQLVFADAETHVQDETLKQETRPEDKVGTFDQYLDHFPTTKLGVGSNVKEGSEGRNFLSGASKPARISFEGNIGVGKSTILKLLQSHPLLQQ